MALAVNVLHKREFTALGPVGVREEDFQNNIFEPSYQDTIKILN